MIFCARKWIAVVLLSIIGCGMFEDEMAHVVSRDEEVGQVLVVEGEHSLGLRKKLRRDFEVVSFESLKRASKSLVEGYHLAIDVLELGLHNYPDLLKEAVYEKVRCFAEFSDGILLFYGLCGNSLMYVERDLGKLRPLFILKDDDGEIVDDCIGAALGGRGAYVNALRSFKGKGAYFLTPAWAANWRDLIKKSRITPNPNDISKHKFIFKYLGYEYVVKLDNGLSGAEFHENVKRFSEMFDLKVVEMKGSPKIAEATYERAKREVLNGARRLSA